MGCLLEGYVRRLESLLGSVPMPGLLFCQWSPAHVQRERKQLEAMAEAQDWEGVEEPPPEPTEAQRRAAERAEEVRRLRKVRPAG